MTCCSAAYVGGKHSDSMQLALPWLEIRGEVYNWPRPPQQQIFLSLLNIIDVDFWYQNLCNYPKLCFNNGFKSCLVN